MERDPDMEITTVQGLLLPLRADLAPIGHLIMGGHAKPTLSELLLPLLA